MHLGVGVPGVDVYANQGAAPAFTNLLYRESTAITALPADDYTFDVALNPSTSVMDSILTVGPLSLAADIDYTAVAVGQLANNDVEVIALVDDRAGIDPANVRLQVTHAASTVGEVDIYEVSDPANPAALLSDVPYKASDTLNVPVADYLIGIDADNDPSTIEFTYDVGLAALGLPGGTFLNVYANESTDGVDLVVQQDDGSVLVIPPTTTTSIRECSWSSWEE